MSEIERALKALKERRKAHIGTTKDQILDILELLLETEVGKCINNKTEA